MGVPEPAHLVGVAKVCPRPGCGSTRVKWRYYNNNLGSQPRYWCMACEKHFTYGGKIRLSEQEKQAAAASMKQLLAEKAARYRARQKAKAQKSFKEIVKAAKSKAASNSEVADDHQFVAVDQPRLNCKRRLIAPATIAKAKSTALRIWLRVTGGAVIPLYSSSSETVQMHQAGADASLQAEAVGHDDSGPQLVTSAASGDESACVGSWTGGSNQEGLDSGPLVPGSEVGPLPDHDFASEGYSEEYWEPLDSEEESVITGHASMRSWECLFS